MDFRLSDLLKRVGKKCTSQQKYLYIQVTDILKFYEVLFRTYCKGLFFLKKKLCLHSSVYAIWIKHSH